jgi:hypothetical protein
MRNPSNSPRVAIVCWASALIFFVFAHSGHAAETKRVMIRFVGPSDCTLNVPPEILVVLNGDETNAFPARLQPDSSKVWIGLWGDRNPSNTFPAAGSKASVRLHRARTDCRQSYADKDPEVKDGLIARFTFRCNTQPVRQVTVQSDPDVHISYVRTLRRATNDDESVDCTETENSMPSKTTVEDVWFETANVPFELLRVQLGSDKSNPKAPGLLVNHPSVLKHIKKSAGTLTGTLDQVRLLAAFQEQRNSGALAAPDVSPNAYENDLARLGKLTADKKNLKVTLTVN